MELYLLKIYKFQKKTQPKVSEHSPYLTVSTFSFFFLYCEFLSLLLRTYIYMVCTKYWPKPKNFAVVDSEILMLSLTCLALPQVTLYEPEKPL